MIKSIVILVIMVLINAGMVFAIFRITKRTSDNLRRFFLDNAGDLFKGVEHSEQVTNTSEEKIIEVEKEKPIYQMNESMVADYKYTTFKEDYKSLRNEIEKGLNKEDIILNVIDENEGNDKNKFGKAISKINEELDFDTIYQLSTVPSEKQVEILNDVFEDKQKEFLQDYISKLDKEFSITDFYNYVQDQSKLLDENYYVKTGWNEDNFDDLNNKVVTVHDEEITEGIKVVHKNKLYDYSI